MHDFDTASLREDFDPTYTGGKLERHWLLESLTEFHQDRLITDILFKVKGGKEANVYCCAAHPETGMTHLAAKVYRPEAFRAMKNDALYRLGREEVDAQGKAIRDSRGQRAMAKRTRTGRAMRSASWIHAEYGALCALFDAGVPVPEPVSLNERAILMGWVGDAARAAPTLHEVDLEPAEAQRVFDAVIQGIADMLACNRIHGDLSPYNILFHAGQAVIIDLPQCVDPDTHPAAAMLLARDVERVCDYFTRHGVRCDARHVTEQLREGRHRMR